MLLSKKSGPSKFDPIMRVTRLNVTRLNGLHCNSSSKIWQILLALSGWRRFENKERWQKIVSCWTKLILLQQLRQMNSNNSHNVKGGITSFGHNAERYLFWWRLACRVSSSTNIVSKFSRERVWSKSPFFLAQFLKLDRRQTNWLSNLAASSRANNLNKKKNANQFDLTSTHSQIRL